MIDKQTNKHLSKALKDKQRKPGWWARRSRKKLIAEILEALEDYEIKSVWAHKAFVSAQEKRPKNITLYIEFSDKAAEGIAEKIGMEMDKAIPKKQIDIINVNTLLPSVREFVFKDVDKIL